MKALILAGGSGTRLWPLSRKNYPKQFLKLNGERSLLQSTADRLLNVVSREDIVVMTNDEYKYYVNSDLAWLENVILEPVCRNTAPAIALGVKYCIEKLGCKEDEVIFVSPSDHIIRPVDRFAQCVSRSKVVAGDGYIVTFGIKPVRPETGYGYIRVRSQKSETGNCDFFKVEKFEEKPDIETAIRYVNEGNYYWNSGMFVFSIGTMLKEFKKHNPMIIKMLDKSFDELLRDYKQMPDIAIECAVMEKSDRVATFPLDIYWNDIGSWDSLYDVLDKDENGNVKRGDILTVDTKRTLIIGNKRHISTIGLEDFLIVETDDAVLIAKKGETQKVKDIVGMLKEDGRIEVDEHVTIYRPWGNYTILDKGPRYKIKRIIVWPNARLSLQMHYHRSEHWVVVSGTAKVTIGNEEKVFHENESTYIPKSTRHRLENHGKVPLEIIEVQNGEYLGEDDIVRMDDVYSRI